MFFSRPLCGAISQSCPSRLPRNTDTWLQPCALRQCRSQNWGAVPQNNFGTISFFYKFSSSLDRSARNFAKWREIVGALKVESKNLGALEEKCEASKNSKTNMQSSVLWRTTMEPAGMTSPNLSTLPVKYQQTTWFGGRADSCRMLGSVENCGGVVTTWHGL